MYFYSLTLALLCYEPEIWFIRFYLRIAVVTVDNEYSLNQILKLQVSAEFYYGRQHGRRERLTRKVVYILLGIVHAVSSAPTVWRSILFIFPILRPLYSLLKRRAHSSTSKMAHEACYHVVSSVTLFSLLFSCQGILGRGQVEAWWLLTGPTFREPYATQ